MIKEALAALGHSARDLFRNWRGLLLLALLYAALLACAYLFFATGVATAWQLTYGSVLAGLATPLLWLLLETGAAHAALPGATAGTIARRAPRDVLKVLLLSLPLIALGVLFVYLLNKLPGWLPKVEEAPQVYTAGPGAGPRPAPLYWQESLVSSLWLLLLGFVLPLVAAHLWLSAAREGLKATLKSLHRVVGRAFTAQSVFIYAVGLFVFGMTPYFVVFTRTAVSNNWAELLIFGLRLALAFVITLTGWVITLGALARVTPPRAEAPAPAEPAAAPPPPEPVAAEPQLQA